MPSLIDTSKLIALSKTQEKHRRGEINGRSRRLGYMLWDFCVDIRQKIYNWNLRTKTDKIIPK